MTEDVLKAHVISDSRYQGRVSRQGNAWSIGFIGKLTHQFGGKVFRFGCKPPISANEDFLPLTDGFGYDEDDFSHKVTSSMLVPGCNVDCFTSFRLFHNLGNLIVLIFAISSLMLITVDYLRAFI